MIKERKFDGGICFSSFVVSEPKFLLDKICESFLVNRNDTADYFFDYATEESDFFSDDPELLLALGNAKIKAGASFWGRGASLLYNSIKLWPDQHQIWVVSDFQKFSLLRDIDSISVFEDLLWNRGAFHNALF